MAKAKKSDKLVSTKKKSSVLDKENKKRAADFIIANKELIFQNAEKEKRAAELIIANTELVFQNDQKEKRAAELVLANIELAFQNTEKEKRAAELLLANTELIYQNEEKEKRAAELALANIELAFQNNEKEKRAAELLLANTELMYQRDEKEKRAAELIVANAELMFQNDQKEKRAAELVIANIELAFQNNEKEKRAAELVLAHKELAFQNDQKEKHAAELIIANYARSLIEASRDPMFAISPKGKITDVNNASVKITGSAREKLIGTDFFGYFTEPEKARTGYQEIYRKGFIVDYQLTIKDLKLTDVLFNGSIYKDEEGSVQGVVVVARDFTDQKRNETELKEAKMSAELAAEVAEAAKAKAEEAVKAKQQFLSNMSHEIRTPMNAIIGFTKVILKTDLTAKQREYMTAIKMSGDALIVLINDILDLAKVDAGKMIFEQTPFKMALSISAMLHLFEPKIQEKNLQLVKEYDDRIPEVLVGDAVRLHQIILNLLSNAVKFTQQGKITVDVRLIDEDEEKATVGFAVTDTGIGIKQENITKIYESFHQASSDTSRIYGGTGLGLAIVKQLVESQGGSIGVVSKEGEGSTFRFILDFKKTNANPEIIEEMLELNPEIKNIRVLVVEDMALNQLLMKTLLDDFGFERDIAGNGKIAIEKLQHKLYDVVLMDLQMPEMDGFEATEYIRNVMKSRIPIIALTADVTTVDLAKCKAVGMNDYIAKPVDERLLYSKIVGIVKKPIKQPERKDDHEKKINRCINLEYLMRRTKSDPALMMEMISLYLEQTPSLVHSMKQSFQAKDWDLLHASVHKMIPSFSIMGIDSNFENMARQLKDCVTTQQQPDQIQDMVLQIENVCNQACKELEEELLTIKKINK